MPRPKGGSLFYKPVPRTHTIRAKRWNIPSILWRALKRACMAIGAMVLLSALITTISLMSVVKKAAPTLPKEMVLVLKLDQGIAEKHQEAGFKDFFPMQQPTIRQVTETIDAAAKDARVKAFIVNLKGGGLTMAHIEEMRQAVKRFRAAGKPAYIYSSSFADTGSGVGAYYLAAAFDEIWMQPVGMLPFSGFAAEIPLARQALEKIGVTPQFLQRENYKTAMESFTGSQLSAESRETWESILSSYSSQILSDIATDRGIAQGTLKTLMEKGLLSGGEALNATLITRLEYGDVLMEELREKITGNPQDENLEFIAFSRYASAKDGAHAPVMPGAAAKPRVGLVHIVGQIVPTSLGQESAAADDIAPAITEAADDDGIKIIVVRIDSPGGSPSASETIRRAIVKAKEKGKTVIVSMGDVAASGGYWIAADADTIFTNRSTLTGSIGVVMGKFEAQELWRKIGVNWESVGESGNAGFWSLNRPFTQAQLTRLNVLIDDTYDAFLTRVAQGRGMNVADVRAIAGGRVWTGAQAIERNLADRQGTLHDALTFAAQELGVKDPADLSIEVLPKPKSPVEQLIELFGQQSQMARAMVTLADTVSAIAPFIKHLDTARAPDGAMTYNAELDFAR